MANDIPASPGEVSSNSDQDFLQAVWRASGYTPRTIEDTHRLVPDTMLQLRELFSDKLASRIIAMPLDSEMARIHTQILESKLPVFSSFPMEGLLLLLIPEGTKPMTSILPAIAREPHKYGGLFKETGKVLGDLYNAGFGVPAVDRDTLLFDKLAFSTSQDSPNATTLYLVPPYEFDMQTTADDLLDYIGTELESSNLFSIAEVTYLANQVDQGWYESDHQS